MSKPNSLMQRLATSKKPPDNAAKPEIAPAESAVEQTQTEQARVPTLYRQWPLRRWRRNRQNISWGWG